MTAPRSDSDLRRSPDKSPSDRDWFRLESNTAPASLPPSIPAQLPGFERIQEVVGLRSKRTFRACRSGDMAWQTIRIISAGDLEGVKRFAHGQDRAAITALDHPNLLRVFEIRELNDTVLIVSELVDTGPLDVWLTRNSVSPHQAAALMEAVCRGLACAHENGIVHGSLTIQQIELQAVSSVPTRASVNTALLSVIPKVSGFGAERTLWLSAYAAPEIAQQTSDANPKSDIYSVGAILYELLVGRPPFCTPNAIEMIQDLPKLAPISPRLLRPSLDPSIERICLKCLEKEPDLRYASAKELAEDLLCYLENRSAPRSLLPLGESRQTTTSMAMRTLLVFAVIATVLAVSFGIWRSLSDRAPVRGPSKDVPSEGIASISATQHPHEFRDRFLQLLLSRQSDSDPGLTLLELTLAPRSADRSTDESDRIRFSNWRRVAYTPIAQLAVDAGLRDRIVSWSWHPSGRWLLAGTRDRCFLWDIESRKEVALAGPVSLRGHPRCAAWSNDGNLIAIGFNSGIAVSPFPDSIEHRVIPLDEPPAQVLFSKNSDSLVVAGTKIGIWDLARMSWRETPVTLPSPAAGLRISPDSKTLIAACFSGPVLVFDALSGKKRRLAFDIPWHGHRPPFDSGLIHVPEFVRDGSAISTLTLEGQIRIYSVDPDSKSLVAAPSSNQGSFRAFSVDPTGKGLVASTLKDLYWIQLSDMSVRPLHAKAASNATVLGHDDKSQQWWYGAQDSVSVAESGSRSCLLQHPRPVIGAAAIRQHLFVTLQVDGIMRIWKKPTTGLQQWLTQGILTNPLVKADQSGEFLISADVLAPNSNQHVLELRSYRTGSRFETSMPSSEAIVAADYSSTACAAIWATKNSVGAWNFEKNASLWQTPIAAPIRDISISNDGRRSAILGEDGFVSLRDVATGREISSIAHVPLRSNAAFDTRNGHLAFSADDALLLRWGFDDEIVIWEVPSGYKKYSISQPNGRVLDVALSPDGRSLVTAHESSPVTFWSAETGRAELNRAPLPGSNGARDVQFDESGKQLLVAGPLGVTTLWDIEKGHLLCTVRQPELVHKTFKITNTPYIVTVSDDCVRIWDSRDGLPMGPGIRLEKRISNSNLLPVNRLHVALVDGQVFELPLSNWLTPAIGSWEELRADAELRSGRRLSPTKGIEIIGTEEWADLLNKRMSNN